MEVSEATHKLVSPYLQHTTLFYRLDCEVKEMWTMRHHRTNLLTGSREKSFLLMKKERHRPQPLHLIKRDSLQTSLGVRNSLAD